MRSLVLPLALVLVLPACSTGASSFDGPTGKLIAGAAAEARVPADLMAAIAHVEGGLRLAPLREVADDELVPVAGALELRHGRFDSLARGAALVGRSQRDLQRELALGTTAGARVLADLRAQDGFEASDLAAWAPALEELSGHAAERDRISYRARVLAVLRAGGDLPARDGEIITLAAHPEIPFSLTVAPPAIEPQDTPEFPGALWFDTPETNKWTSGRGGNPITMIAIHDTEGGWDASVATLQNDTGKSVHYIVDADGSRVGQFVHEADTAWHAGNWYYNQHMVGIEHVGFASDDNYQTAMYVTSASLVRAIADRQKLGPNGDGSGLDRSTIVGHQEIPNGNVIAEDSPPCSDSPGSCVKNDNYGGANNHRDPGVYWEWCEYMEMVGNGATCKCNDAYDLFNCVHDGSERVKCPSGTVVIDHCANNSCMVEPLGTDDICGQKVPPPTSSSSSGSGAGGSGSTSASTSGAGGSGGAGGAGGNVGTTGSGAGGSHNQKGSGCAVSGTPASGDLAALGALAAAALLSRRRRR